MWVDTKKIGAALFDIGGQLSQYRMWELSILYILVV